MTIEEMIATASEVYDGDGLIQRYHDAPYDQHGDGLAKFIASELAENFDTLATDQENRQEAARLMRTAIAELTRVAEAFE